MIYFFNRKQANSLSEQRPPSTPSPPPWFSTLPSRAFCFRPVTRPVTAPVDNVVNGADNVSEGVHSLHFHCGSPSVNSAGHMFALRFSSDAEPRPGFLRRLRVLDMPDLPLVPRVSGESFRAGLRPLRCFLLPSMRRGEAFCFFAEFRSEFPFIKLCPRLTPSFPPLLLPSPSLPSSRWTNARTAPRSCAAAAPLSCLVSSAAVACARTAPPLVVAAVLYYVRGTRSSPWSAILVGCLTASFVWRAEGRSPAFVVVTGPASELSSWFI